MKRVRASLLAAMIVALVMPLFAETVTDQKEDTQRLFLELKHIQPHTGSYLSMSKLTGKLTKRNPERVVNYYRIALRKFSRTVSDPQKLHLKYTLVKTTIMAFSEKRARELIDKLVKLPPAWPQENGPTPTPGPK